MRQKIINDMKVAMKNKDKETLAVIRMVKGAMQLEELNLKRELSDDEVIGIISKQIKIRKESIIEFEKAKRNDLIEKNNQEIEILNHYMPEQLSENEINQKIESAISEINAISMKDMGKVMSVLTPILKGRADMAEVSKKIQEKLNH